MEEVGMFAVALFSCSKYKLKEGAETNEMIFHLVYCWFWFSDLMK